MTPLILSLLMLTAPACAQGTSDEGAPTIKVFLLAGQSNMEGHAVADRRLPRATRPRAA